MRHLLLISASVVLLQTAQAEVLFGDKSSGFVVSEGCSFVVAEGATLDLAGTFENNGTLEVAGGGAFYFSNGVFVDHGSRILRYETDTTLYEDIPLSGVHTLTAQAVGESSEIVLSGNGQRIVLTPNTAHQIVIGAGTRLILDHIELAHFSTTALSFGEGASLEIRDGTISFEAPVEDFNYPLYFSGSSCVQGDGDDFNFAGNGRFTVLEGQTLSIDGVRFTRYAREPIQCVDAEGVVRLSNCTFIMAYDDLHDETFFARFSNGSLVIGGAVTFGGRASFSYLSAAPLTLQRGALLAVDHIRFLMPSVQSIVGDTEDLFSSRMLLESAELHVAAESVTVFGVRLISRGQSMLTGEGATALAFGDNSVLNRSAILVENGELLAADLVLSVLDREIIIISPSPPLFEA